MPQPLEDERRVVRPVVGERDDRLPEAEPQPLEPLLEKVGHPPAIEPLPHQLLDVELVGPHRLLGPLGVVGDDLREEGDDGGVDGQVALEGRNSDQNDLVSEQVLRRGVP